MQRTEDSLETLTDLSVMHRVTITDYITFRVDNVASKNIYILCFSNDKPHITKEADVTISKKKLAFKNTDCAGVASNANGTKPPSQTIKRTTAVRR